MKNVLIIVVTMALTFLATIIICAAFYCGQLADDYVAYRVREEVASQLKERDKSESSGFGVYYEDRYYDYYGGAEEQNAEAAQPGRKLPRLHVAPPDGLIIPHADEKDVEPKPQQLLL